MIPSFLVGVIIAFVMWLLCMRIAGLCRCFCPDLLPECKEEYERDIELERAEGGGGHGLTAV